MGMPPPPPRFGARAGDGAASQADSKADASDDLDLDARGTSHGGDGGGGGGAAATMPPPPPLFAAPLPRPGAVVDRGGTSTTPRCHGESERESLGGGGRVEPKQEPGQGGGSPHERSAVSVSTPFAVATAVTVDADDADVEGGCAAGDDVAPRAPDARSQQERKAQQDEEPREPEEQLALTPSAEAAGGEYEQPEWGGLPDVCFSLEVLKEGGKL